MFLNIIMSVNMKYYTIYLPFTKREGLSTSPFYINTYMKLSIELYKKELVA